MKITHLVTLLTCFTLSLSLPQSGNPLPVTSPSTRHTTGEGTRTPDSIFQPTIVSSSTQGIKLDTTSATEVMSSTSVGVTTHSTKTRATPPTSVITTTSTRRGTTRDQRCTVRSLDIRPHIIDSVPDSNTEDAVEERALCKFEYTANIDKVRYPEIMPEVVCPAKRCGHCGGDGRCEPVRHSFKVLRRCRDLDDDGNYLYRYDYERLTIACVCATPALKDAMPSMTGRRDTDDGPAPAWD